MLECRKQVGNRSGFTGSVINRNKLIHDWCKTWCQAGLTGQLGQLQLVGCTTYMDGSVLNF